MRQRVRTHTTALASVARLVLALVCLVVIWYGLMLCLLALKVDPDVVDRISGYRTALEFLDSVGPNSYPGGPIRAAIAIAGVLGFFLFGFLALRALPQPYLTRADLALAEDHRGALTVSPRAIERAAEAAANRSPAIVAAHGRYEGEDVAVDVSLAHAGEAASALEDVRGRVTDALGRHDLPPVPVNVTLTGFEPDAQPSRRELT